MGTGAKARREANKRRGNVGTGAKGKQKANMRRGHVKGWGDMEMGAKGR